MRVVAIITVALLGTGINLSFLSGATAEGQAGNSTIVAGYRFTSFDAPGATGGATVAHHINNGGVITGEYFDSNGTPHGFVRAKDGTFTSFDAPLGVAGTDPEYINDEGDIVGHCFDANVVAHGFLRDHKGTLRTIDVAFAGTQLSSARAINSKGEIVGDYVDASGLGLVFLRSPDGQFTAVNPPGNVFGAYGMSVTNRGAIDGVFQDSNSVYQGFLRQADGSITTFDAPAAGTGNGQGTFPAGIFWNDSHNGVNERGDLTGAAVDASYTAHGFLRTHDGNFVSFDVPGNAVGNYNGTAPSSINSSGTIAGTYFDNNGSGHGFVRYPDGSIVSFDAPGVAPSPGGGTNVFVINDSGVLAGVWGDASGNFHGFVMERNED